VNVSEDHDKREITEVNVSEDNGKREITEVNVSEDNSTREITGVNVSEDNGEQERTKKVMVEDEVEMEIEHLVENDENKDTVTEDEAKSRKQTDIREEGDTEESTNAQDGHATTDTAQVSYPKNDEIGGCSQFETEITQFEKEITTNSVDGAFSQKKFDQDGLEDSQFGQQDEGNKTEELAALNHEESTAVNRNDSVEDRDVSETNKGDEDILVGFERKLESMEPSNEGFQIQVQDDRITSDQVIEAPQGERELDAGARKATLGKENLLPPGFNATVLNDENSGRKPPTRSQNYVEGSVPIREIPQALQPPQARENVSRMENQHEDLGMILHGVESALGGSKKRKRSEMGESQEEPLRRREGNQREVRRVFREWREQFRLAFEKTLELVDVIEAQLSDDT